MGTLWAVSDLHVGHPENREILRALRPESADDWLIVAGDVSERFGDVVWALGELRKRFGTVIWSPGNHELWTPPTDPITLGGEERYQALVLACRELGVLTPEDPYAVWPGESGPVTVVPLFTLYDYTWRMPEATSKEHSLAIAYQAGIVCTDEALLHHEPYATREEWCWARCAYSEKRLAEVDGPTVLVNHWPLVREPTRVLFHPEFAQWCGTDRTADWHTTYRAQVAVYGHLHIPRTTEYDGVRFEEVSLGYPREWRPRPQPPRLPRRIL